MVLPAFLNHPTSLTALRTCASGRGRDEEEDPSPAARAAFLETKDIHRCDSCAASRSFLLPREIFPVRS
jgi:hypothetical protein